MLQHQRMFHALLEHLINWSTTMSQNSRALCFRCTIIGESLTSTG